MNYDILVPITFLLLLFFGIKIALDSQLGKRKAQLDVLVAALQNNQTLPEGLWDDFQQSIDPKRNDLRKALLFLVLTFIALILAFSLPFQDSTPRQVLLTVSIIPGVFCGVYFGFWRFWYTKN